MSNIKKGSKLTVSTANGISRDISNNLGVLEISGPGMTNIAPTYGTNPAHLVIGATDVSGILQIGINDSGHTFIDANINNNHKDIIMQKYGGNLIVGSGVGSISKVGIQTDQPSSTFHINSTDGIIIPVGTNDQRPVSAVQGMMRYNTTTSQFEGYGPGNAWGSLGGVKDVDGDTYILAETSAGADNDALQFYTAGQQRLEINSAGLCSVLNGGKVGIDSTGSVYRSKLQIGTLNTSYASWEPIYKNPSSKMIIFETQGVDWSYSNNTYTADATIILARQLASPNGNSSACDTGAIGFVATTRDYGSDQMQLASRIRGETVGSSYGGRLFFETNEGGQIKKRMTIKENGNVGIGTTSPGEKLEVNGNIKLGNSNGTIITDNQIYRPGNNVFHIQYGGSGDLTMCNGGGHVGIGASAPGYPLVVNGSSSSGSPNNLGYRNYMYTNSSANYSSANNWTTNPHSFSAYFANSIIIMGTYIVLASDRRIKKDITDVNDSYALTTLRNIPVRYYYYRDQARSPNRTIGFIAQEVREVLPEAIELIPQIIPDEMRFLTNISWNGNTLYTDLSDCSGVKYRFYVANDASRNDEIRKEVVGNSDNSFTFDSSYNIVFCYGKEVDDFHSIDKNKLYTINFSATQEIDRIQQQEITKVQSIQTDLSNANTTIQQQATKITTLETQIADILTRLSNLENTGSS